jgi:selenocysteine lyase/cysteine desulfurase
LSPFEHPAEERVANWVTHVAGGEIRRIVFGPDDFVKSWEQQEEHIVRAVVDYVPDKGGPIAVFVLSEVSFATGMIIPVRALRDKIRRALPEDRRKKLRIIIDGAHSMGDTEGLATVNEWEAYVLSAHKWLLAPEPCGILISLNSGHRVEKPYDVWRDELPVTTSGVRMVAGVLASMNLIDTINFGSLKFRSAQVRDRFLKNVDTHFRIVQPSSSDCDFGMMRAIRPAAGWRWKYKGNELREYFRNRSAHGLLLHIDPDTPWLRVSFAFFLDASQIDKYCKILEASVEEDR